MSVEETAAEQEVANGYALEAGEMFGTQTESLEGPNAASTILADWIVREDAKLEEIEADLKKRKAVLEESKTQLATMILQSGQGGFDVPGGLHPKAKIVTKYFKASEVTDEQLFAWLTENNLGGIIKPTVHFQTMQSTLKEFIEQGGKLPEIFNVVDTPTVTMFGKSKYLAHKLMESVNG
jgi:hypothetical protein